MRDVDVITINYNSSRYTLQCVRSIIEKTDRSIDYRIIIVDNHSEESDFRNLSQLHSEGKVEIIRRSSNGGFALANMEGVKKADARYLYFLNNDTRLENDVISILLHFIEQNEEAGIISGQMYHEDGTAGVNFNYFPDLKLKLLGSGILRVIQPEKYPKKKVPYRKPLEVPLVNGSSMFVRKQDLEAAGGFDTRFFLYCEEEDLALRFRKINKKCFLIPEARYTHYVGKSSLKDNDINFLMLREFYLSQHLLYLKHYGKAASYVWRITQFFRSLRKFYKSTAYVRLAFFILRGPGPSDSLRTFYEEKNTDALTKNSIDNNSTL